MRVNFVPKLTEKKEVLALVADKKSILDFKELDKNILNKILSEHENIDGIWLFRQSDIDRRKIINNTISNLKRYWCPNSKNIDWYNNEEIFLNEFLYQSTQVKNIWIPYGE